MDINALRVFNVVHRLAISEAEFASIENELAQKDRTGFYVACIKKRQAICVSHDDGHSILIKQFKTKFPAPCRILFKTVITFDDLPPEVYVLHSIAQYRTSDDIIKFRADNLEQLKDRICDRFVDNYPKSLGESCDNSPLYPGRFSNDETQRSTWKNTKTHIIDSQLRALFWLFGEDYGKFESEVQLSRDNIARIIKVFERNNRRLAVIQRTNNYKEERRGGCMCGVADWEETIRGSEIMIRCFKPADKQYDYVDVNRELYLGSSYREHGEIWLADDLFEKTGYNELKVLSKRLFEGTEPEGGHWLLLTADELNKKQSLIRIEAMEATRRDQEEAVRSRLGKSIQRQFDKGKLVRHGITFTKSSIECEGVEIRSPRLGAFITRNHIHLQEEPDFGKIARDFVCDILSFKTNESWMSNRISYECEFKGDETIYIGKVKLHLEAKKNSVFINDHRIRKDDLLRVVLKALTYTDQASFDEYLAYSSGVNLRLQKALADGGLSVELCIDKTDDNSLSKNNSRMLLSLPLKRVNGKNYTTIGGIDHKIQDIDAFFSIGKSIDYGRVYSQGGYLQRAIKLLYRAIEGVTPKDLGDLIREAGKEYKRVQALIHEKDAEKLVKANAFVKHAVEVCKAKKLKDGFLVRGLSGKVYTVNEKTLAVYEQLGDKVQRYVCIVDMNTPRESEWGRKDALAKRLFLLSHDLTVAREISTLNLQGWGVEPELVEV